MQLDEFQRKALRTAGSRYLEPTVDSLEACALAITGEAGEVADIIKKWAAQGKALDRAHLSEELGDVLWGLAILAHRAGLSLSEIAAGNVDKLRARFPNGPRTLPAPELPEWIVSGRGDEVDAEFEQACAEFECKHCPALSQAVCSVCPLAGLS